jgi:hypothetical protein
MKDCLNYTSNNSLAQDFHISHDCALFDFSIYTIVAGSLCVLGLLGNIISFTVLWRDSGKSATAFLLRALAVADSLVLLMAMPLYVASSVFPLTGVLENYYKIYPNLIPYLWPCYQIPYTGTILLTVLVSLNRYFAVCKPYKSIKMCSTAQARKQVFYVAIFSIFYNIPRFFEYEKVEICTGINESTLVFESGGIFGKNLVYRIIYANILYFLVMHGGPLLSLAFLNYKLIIALKKRQQRRAEMGKGGYQQDITLVLVVVIFVFMICQTPTFVDHILWTAVDSQFRQCGYWHYYYTAVGDLLAILNSSVNFLIYILTSRKFRQLLKTSCTTSHELMRMQSDRADMTLLSQAPTNHHVS